MKKRSLTRSKNYNNLEELIKNRDKSDKKVIFKTLDVHSNFQNENRIQKKFDIFNGLKKQKNGESKNSVQLFFIYNYAHKRKNNINIKTSRPKLSFNNLDYGQLSTRSYSMNSKIFLRNIIKINKPKLLKMFNRDLIYNKEKDKNKDEKINIRYIKIPSNFIAKNDNKTIDDYIYDKSTTSRLSNDNKISKNFFKDINKDNEEINNDIIKEFAETFTKLPKIKLNFPLNLPNSVNSDKEEIRDRVNTEFFTDEKLKRKLRKALYFEINSFEDDDKKYIEYKKSLQNYINYIYDINLVPHLQNNLLYNKPINENSKINELLISKNSINKEDAKSLNRYLINNIKKKEMEEKQIKEREKKLKELTTSNNYLKKLCSENEDDELPKLTSDEIVELNDFFGKNIVYKSVTFASYKLKNIVYSESKPNYFKKYRKNFIPLYQVLS